MRKNLVQKIKLIPQKPGIYLFKDKAGRILYIGKALNLKNRVSSHFKKNDSLIGQFRQKIATMDYIKTENETQALILEDQLIKKYQPKFNIQRKDDKSYFWVAISNDEWPRVQITHKPKFIRHPELPAGGEGSKKDSSRLAFDESKRAASSLRMTNNIIGPFVNGTELKKTLRALRKILPYRTCKNSYEKPCLQWHIGLCPAHTRSKSPIASNELIINPPKAELSSGQPSFLKEGGVVFSKKMTRVDLLNIYNRSLNTLKQLLRLYAGEPLRIEAYDISNIQGASATGSMIVFAGVKPKKSDYRKFKIKTVRGANDVAMLKEVLRRRLRHREWPLPNLVLIDGGRAQLNSAALVIRNSRPAGDHPKDGKLEIPLISLAKRDEELYTIYSNRTLPLNALSTNLRLACQAIRNEAHRFAISYYRRLHRKNIRK